jgi:hypothetical protein
MIIAKTNGAHTHSDDDWYDDPSPDLDVEWVHQRTAELGPKFVKLVDVVMREMSHAQRDFVSAWLINCVDRFAAQDKIERKKVRDWARKVGKTAASLARLLEREVFPKGTAQADFGFVFEDLSLPSTNDIDRLWKMTRAAEHIARAWQKKGAPKRHHREDLLLTLSYGYEEFALRRANLGKQFLGVVEAVFDFIGEPREKASIHGAVNRMLKARRRRHAGGKKGRDFS